MIPIFRPWFGEEEVDAVREVLLSGWVGQGQKVTELEKRFAEFVGTRFAVSLNSGSAALFLSLRLLGIEGKEVVTTPMTFVATNHAILQNGGTPVFCDIEPDTLNIDPERIAERINENTAAILIVHFAGHPCDMDPILDLAKKRDIPVVEDVAHATGARYKGRILGSLGTMGCFSFHAVKNLSTGDGGMLTTNDPDRADRLKRLRWMGISKNTWDRFRGNENGRPAWDYEVPEAGFKHHMNDIAASIGLVQLGKLDSANAQRREIALQYDRAFSDLEWFQTPTVKEYAHSAFHAYIGRAKNRDGLISYLASLEIDAGVHYRPNHLHEVYAPFRTELPVVESVWKDLITIPLFPSMTNEEVDRVVQAVRSYDPNGREA